MAQERDDFILGFQADLSGLREYLGALRGLPNAVDQIASRVSSADFGGGQISAQQGQRLARTILRAFENELKGGAGFERTLRTALGKLDFGIPPQQLAKLKQQLDQVRQAAAGPTTQARRPIGPTPGPRLLPAQTAPTGQIPTRRPIAPTPPPAPPRPLTAEESHRAQRDREIKGLLRELREITAEELTRERISQKILEIERGITQAIDAQAAATRGVNARLSPKEAQRLAEQNLSRRQRQAGLSDDEFRLIEQSNRARVDASSQRQQFRNQGGLTGAARAASISPDGSTSAEQFFRTARGVTAFTATAFPLYAAMNLVTQGLREATLGTLEYEDALSKISVSLNADKGSLRDFASSIGSVANSFGLTQSQGIEAAARGVGAFGVGADSGISSADQQDFLKRAVTIAGQINYQSGSKDLISTQQNVAGTLRSFNLANSEIEDVADSTTVISKRFGVLASDLLNTTAQIGTQAQAAGFNLPQTQAIIANQAKNTGQTPDAVAGFFSQVLAQADSTNVTRKLRGVGVDTDNTTLAQQIEQLSKLVAAGQISQARLNDVSSAFGRGRSSQALQILVRDFAKVQGAATDAKSSPGAAQEIFAKLFNNINAEFRKLVGNLRGIITELAQSGLLDFLGALLITTEHLTALLYEFLQIFNQIPRPLRTVSFLFLEIAGAVALISRYGGVAKLLRDVGGAIAATFNVLRTAQATQAAGTAGAIGSNLRGQAIRRNADRRILDVLGTPIGRLGPADAGIVGSRVKSGFSAGLAALGGPVGAAALVATLAAAGVFKTLETRKETNRAVDRANNLGNTATTSEELRAAAAAQREAADKARAEQRGGFNFRTIATLGISTLLANTVGPQEGQVADAKRRAAELEAAAARLDTQRSGTAGTPAAFNGFESSDDVKKAFDEMDAAGYSASLQLALVGDAMDALALKAKGTAAAIIPGGGRNQFINAFGGVATKSIQDAINQADLRKQATDRGTFGFLNPIPSSESSDARNALSTLKGIDTDEIRKGAIANADKYLNSIGKTGTGEQTLSADELKGLEDAQYNFIKSQLDPQLKLLPTELQRTLLNSLKIYAKKDVEGQFGNANNGAAITPDVVANGLSAVQSAADKAFQNRSQYTKIGATREQRDALKAGIADAQAQQYTLTGKDFTDAGRYISAAQDQLALINKDLATQLAAYNAGKSKLKLLRGQGDDSAALLNNQLQSVRDQRAATTDPQEQLDLDLQAAELQNQKRKAGLELITNETQAGRDPRNLGGQAKDAVDAARRALTDARGNGGPLEVAQAQTALNEAIQQQRDVALSISKARAAARVKPGDAVAAAQLALNQARQDKGAALRGSQAYYDAIVAIAQARKEVATALNQRAYNKDLLRIDLTDPVAQARADVRDARRQLNSAKGPDDRDTARINLRNKQNSAEAAAFSQRLSDVQTADELGRISHQAYLSYLQNEHNRLSAIGKRTRQQQDQLDQVDKLLKSASDQLNGQFNLGNIKLPTIYEVRRAIAAGSSGVGGIAKYQTAQSQVSVDNSVRSVTLQGVPIQEVYKYVQSVLGTNATKTSSTGGR